VSKLAGKVDFERFGKWDERAESGGLWRGVPLGDPVLSNTPVKPVKVKPVSWS
jgi:hypothetical protein